MLKHFGERVLMFHCASARIFSCIIDGIWLTVFYYLFFKLMLLKDNLYMIECIHFKSTVLLFWQTYISVDSSEQSRYRIFITPKSSFVSHCSKCAHDQPNANIPTFSDYALLFPPFAFCVKIIYSFVFCTWLLLHSKLFLRFI